MLKCLFTLWLMLSVLGLGTAWAYDSHTVFAGHDAASGTPVHDSQDDGDSAGCNHCCHLGFHLLGVPSEGVMPEFGGGHRHFASAEFGLTSTPRDPPVRPPRS